MSSVESRQKPDDYVYIDLDEPRKWWSSLVGLVAIILIATILVAPWMIDLGTDQPDQVANNALQSSGSICRPDSSGLPQLLDPTVASWGRFCEWFIDPPTGPAGEQ